MQVKSISAKEKVNDKFWPLINSAVAAYEELFKEDLRGVFLVGSVSRGAEIENISDIDVIAAADRTPTDEDKEFLSHTMSELRSLARDLGLTKIDLVAYDLESLKSSVHKQFMLRIDGFQIYGEDIGLHLPFPEVGKDLAIFLNSSIAKNIERAKELLGDPHAEDYLPARGRWIAKKAIRLALGIIMVRKPIYTHNMRETIALVKEGLEGLRDVVSRLENAINNPPQNQEEYKKLLVDVESIYVEARVVGICE